MPKPVRGDFVAGVGYSPCNFRMMPCYPAKQEESAVNTMVVESLEQLADAPSNAARAVKPFVA